MAQKLLVVVPAVIPTVEIITRTLNCLDTQLHIKIVLASSIKIKDLFSGEYKILFIRICDPSFSNILYALRTYQIPYLYYLDDNFWEIGKSSNTPLAKHYADRQLIETLNGFVTNAQAVIVSTQNLREYINHLNERIRVINAAFDFSLIHDLKRKPCHQSIKIFYAGSSYREQDFIHVTPALKKIVNEFPQVNIHFNGFIPQALKNCNNIFYDETFYSYDEHIKKQFINAYDIGIAPITDTPSNRAKTNLKYREYGACQIAGIYSNIPPYSECIRQHKNGYLVENSSEAWYKALKRLIEDKQLRENIACAAYQDVNLNYTHKIIARVWSKALEELPYPQKPSKSILQIRAYLKINQAYLAFVHKSKRAKDYYQTHGLIFTCGKIVRSLWLTLYYKTLFLIKKQS